MYHKLSKNSHRDRLDRGKMNIAGLLSRDVKPEEKKFM